MMKRILFYIGLFTGGTAYTQDSVPEFNLYDSVFQVGAIYTKCNILWNQPGGARLRPESGPCLDSIAAFLLDHPQLVIAINSHSDQRGSDANNLNSTEMRSKTIKDYFISKDIPEYNLAAVGYGETLPLWTQEEINAEPDQEWREEMYIDNIRTDFEIIHIRKNLFALTDTSFFAGGLMQIPVDYEIDKPEIRPVSFHFLDSLATFLIAHKELTVEIQVHNDVHPSTYGQCLTCKRAQSVRDYLISKGVPEKQLLSNGFGDAMPLISYETCPKAPGENGREELKKFNRRTYIYIAKVN